MHGDDVASAGVEVTTQIVSKATEIIMDLLKIAIEREREGKRNNPNADKILSGGEVTYQKLKAGGEVTMIPSFDKNDYGEFVKRAKKMNIPVAAIQEHGKENTLSLFINVKDKEAANAIIQDIIREKMKQPEQTERMITIEKEQVEAFQTYCSEHDIPVNFMESKNGVKCIFGQEYEKQIQTAVEHFQQINSELSKTSIEVTKGEKGKPKIVVDDDELGKRLTINFCPKAKVERILQEQLGYSEEKAVAMASKLSSKLSDEKLGYYLSGSRQLEQMEYYEKDIRLDDDNLLLDKYSFAKMQLRGEEAKRLTITDEKGRFVVISENNRDRAGIERSIKQHLGVEDSETVKAIMTKAEKLGFVDAPRISQYKEFLIERDTQSSFTVRGGSTVVRLDLTDKETAKKQLRDSFGMKAAKAERIISKAEKQSVVQNLLRKAKEKVHQSADTLKRKTRERGSRK
ncbi:DUF3801 domain-containing protein [Ruminococcus sp.]|uniref:DUF3801 domain-containing protein n=1 Tax=Ruminococcus sp. TaxID=41978 RepID=UPI0025CFD2C5|nr:DUF3801 domain-containing protein [Ruminococcus sp.]MBR1433284.1 DUF3801 domain-containing protein [Ruminococcus sp.]